MKNDMKENLERQYQLGRERQERERQERREDCIGRRVIHQRVIFEIAKAQAMWVGKRQ